MALGVAQLRRPARVQLPGNPPRGERHPVRHRGLPAGGGRHRRGHRRDPVDVPHGRRGARRDRAARQLRPRGRVLDRRPGGARPRDHPRLPHGLAGCEDRTAGPGLRPGRDRRPAQGLRPPRRRHRRRPAGFELPAGDRGRCGGGGDGAAVRKLAPEARHAARPRARLRRAHRRASLDLPHHPPGGRIRERHLAGRVLALHRQRSRLDALFGGPGARLRLPAHRSPDG